MGQAQVLVIGDSIVEGLRLATLADRWVTRIQARLRGLTQGAQVPFIPGFYNMDPFPTDAQVAHSGTVGRGTTEREAQLSQPDSAITYTFTGTSAKLHVPTWGVSVMVAVDGGTPVEVVPSMSSLWSTGALTRGSHTVRVTRAGTSGVGYVEGLTVYDGDETTGVRVVEMARSGRSSGHYAVAARREGIQRMLTLTGPYHLVVITLGTNDYNEEDLTVLRTNRDLLVAAIRAVYDGPILIIGQALGGGRDLTRWLAREQVWRDIATATTGVHYETVRTTMPDNATDGSLYADGNHPNPAGHARLADIITGMLSTASTPTDYFDGATSNVDPFAYTWSGTANNSESTKRYAVAVSGTAPAPRSMSGSGLSSNAAMTSDGNARVYVEGDYLVVDSITSTSGATSAYIARGTTAAGDAMKRLNLVPGKTYAMGVLYSQDMAHTTTAGLPRQMSTVYRNAAGSEIFNHVASNVAPNEVQVDTPLTMAFTVPADAQDYAVRLLSGAQGMLDRAKFRNLIICEGVNEADALSKVQAYFDGDTVFGGWTGVANRSTSEFPRNGTQNLPILPVSSAQRTNVVIPGESWCDISVGGEGTLTLAGLIGQILPTGQTVEPGDFIPGRGNTGVRLSGNPSVTGYSAALNNASVGMTAEFVETGAWEQ